MSKVKIHYIANYAGERTDLNVSPAGNTKMRYMISALNSVGFALEVFSTAEVKKGISFGRRCKTPEGVKVRYIFSVAFSNMFFKRAEKLWNKLGLYLYLKKLGKDDIVVIYHNTPYMPVIRYLKSRKFRLIYEIEELYSLVSGKSEKAFAAERDFFGCADAYVFATEMLDDIVNPTGKPNVTVYGTYKSEPERGTADWGDGKIHCLYAGTFNPNKGGAAIAIKCAEYLDARYHIHILGFGTDLEKTAVAELTEKTQKKTDCTVTYDGCLSGEDYISFLQKCDIGMSTQNADGAFNATSFPSKILSYLSNGLRVVSIRIEALERSSVNDLLAYYNKNDPKELAKAIVETDMKEPYDSRRIIDALDSKFRQNLCALLENAVKHNKLSQGKSMKLCDVVLDTIWYDPRVRKQLIEYKRCGIDLCAVGLRDSKYDDEKMKTIPCDYKIVSANAASHIPGLSSIIKKLHTHHVVRDAIVEYQPDIIHANDLTALIPAYAAAKRLKCSLIYDSHEINTENYSRKKKYFYSFMMKRIEKYLVHKVDQMVCVSNAAADYFAATYKIERPMVVTNCSLKSEQYISEKKQENRKFEVLNHGMYYNNRGYDLMTKALDLLTDYPEIRLAVRGYGSMESEMRETVKKSNNKDAFIFYPPVNTSELIENASKSDVGVAVTVPISLNFKLSISNKVFEYAAAGLPVIMSDIPEHEYLNDKYHFGIIIKNNSPEELVNAIIKMYTDKTFYNKCVENAKNLSDDLNWENEFSKLIKTEKTIYKNLLEKRKK